MAERKGLDLIEGHFAPVATLADVVAAMAGLALQGKDGAFRQKLMHILKLKLAEEQEDLSQ
jgi:hypothetical protein